MNPHEDDQLRSLLDDAVSDVEPRPALDTILTRTKVTAIGSRRPWLLGAAAAVVATAATIAAVAVTSNGPGTSKGPDIAAAGPSVSGSPSPSSSESSSPPSTEPSGPEATTSTTPIDPLPGQTALPVYYVGETGQGPRLFREFHPGTDPAVLLQEAVDDAVAGQPEDPDYFSPWPADTRVEASFDGVGDTGTITLSVFGDPSAGVHDRPAGMSAEVAEMAVQQLVYTAQAATQTTAPVRFLGFGEITDQILGVPVSEPLGRADGSSTLAQVWITAPDDGAVVQPGFVVEGLGAFFEANVTWELRQGDEVVLSGFTTAQECCRMAPYSFRVKGDVPPGDYELVVMDSDVSGGEGLPPFEDTKTVTITD